MLFAWCCVAVTWCGCTYVCVDLLVFVVLGLLGLFGVGGLLRLIGLWLSVSVWVGVGFGAIRLVC